MHRKVNGHFCDVYEVTIMMDLDVLSDNLSVSRSAWPGLTDADSRRGASLALGGLRTHRGPSPRAHHRVLLHWQGQTTHSTHAQQIHLMNRCITAAQLETTRPHNRNRAHTQEHHEKHVSGEKHISSMYASQTEPSLKASVS